MGKLINRKKHLFSEEELEDDEIDDMDEDDFDIDEDEDDVEEDDDDDDDDDDDIEEEDDEVEEEESEEDRRSYRRKRRVRNQIIAYSVVVLFIIALVIGGIVAGQRISTSLKAKKQEAELEAARLEQEQEQQQPDEMIIEAPPTIEVATIDEQLDEIVDNFISTMPLEDKIAGLFIITPEALTGVENVTQAADATQEALNQYAVGGLIYFSQNILDKEQLTEMISATTSRSRYPIFFAVDEEGGEVSRVANSDIEVIKVDNMADIGANGDAAAAYETGMTIGSYLKDLGFNLNFAPVADVVTDEGSDILGSRSFGTDAGVCAEMVTNVVDGMQGTGVSACLKHFPGVGSANEDTHDGKVEMETTLDSMKNSDFIPFQAGIEAGADFVMVSHVVAVSLDEDMVPSSFSSVVVTDILRGELGFDGVIITDALDMGAITDNYASDEAAIKAIVAGVDMLLMPENFEEAYTGLLTAVQEGIISEERINESLRRIYRIKYANKLT